jgi:hypothetical protein
MLIFRDLDVAMFFLHHFQNLDQTGDLHVFFAHDGIMETLRIQRNSDVGGDHSPILAIIYPFRIRFLVDEIIRMG